MLLVRDGYAPGWRAWVDDVPVPVRTAEGHYRAVPVDAGRHHVRFVYRPPGLRAGLAVMALSLGAFAVLMLRGRQAAPGPSSAGVG